MADTPQTRSSGLLPTGLSDLMPQEAAREASAVAMIMGSFASLGYARVKPPLVEFEDTLLADGPGSVLAQDTFRVMDPQSSRMMAIRADMTAQIARIAGTRMAHQPRPLRLAYAGDVLRVRPDPLNPERQLTQVGAEMIGAHKTIHDAELAIAALVALERAGVQNITIDLGAPKLYATIVGSDDNDALKGAVAAKDHMLIKEHGAKHADLLCRLLDLPMAASDKTYAEVTADLPKAAAVMMADLKDMAAMIKQAVPQIRVTIDPLEARGFDYHHGVGFAIFAPGIRGELGRGGRYRTMLADDQGEESTGVTLYLERVLRALPDASPSERIYIPHEASVDDQGFGAWIALSLEGRVCCFGQADLADDKARLADARLLGATHILLNGAVEPLNK